MTNAHPTKHTFILRLAERPVIVWGGCWCQTSKGGVILNVELQDSSSL